ncbi:Hint domain-containing protein [Acidiphilium sp. AL]|uniref:Hint domain-containing protein n=1 Tax=Acidiphilium sp. AL TaxID=2871704 RepID=UPI0021CB1DD3|nr:Hint domain-containing protein [Acidiphilium sp. AL]
MSGSNTVVATETLTSGATTVSAPVTRTISGGLSNSGTPTITTVMYVPVGVEVTITNNSTIEISGQATEDRVKTGPFYAINYDEGIGLQVTGTLSTVINNGKIVSDTTLFVPNGLTTYNVYGIGLSVQAGKVVNAAGALIYGVGDGAALLASTMTNYGTVMGHKGAGNLGVIMQASGVSNAASAVIAGGYLGIYEQFFEVGGTVFASTVVNSGLIEATGLNGAGTGAAILGGNLTNAKGGTILGFSAGAVYATGAVLGKGNTLTNDGLISLTGTLGDGVEALFGTLINQANGTIAGVKLGSTISSGTLQNSGLIAPPLTNVAGVFVNAGSGTNFSGGVIEADHYGVAIGAYSATASFSNAGTIEAIATNAGEGVFLDQGSFANQATGTVSGYKGIVGNTLAISLYNDGIVAADGTKAAGVAFTLGTLVNDGVIGGATAVAVAGTATVSIVDAGALASTLGTLGMALTDPSGAVALTLDPGASLVGSVVLDATAESELVLASATSAGSLTGLGETITGFADISFASGASWTIEGDSAGLAAGQTISGFAQHDTIVLDSFAATSDSFVSGTGLELTSGSSTITLDITGSFTTSDFAVTDPPTNTTIALVPPCFVAGTHILTATGEVAAEDLREGDRVVLHGGGTAPAKWIGRRRLDLRRHPRPETVRPILIEAGAICGGVPKRDLLVSPDHALFLDGHLIPAKALENGATIRQVARRGVTYFHVELEHHAALYAEGCPAESYLETGNRGAFENGGVAMVLHPDLAQVLREVEGFAPFAESGAVVEAVRARLIARAGIETTDDPGLTIRYRRDGSAVIESRSAIPGHLMPDPRDRRMLGVKIAALRAGGADIRLDHPLLAQGWHDAEPDGRWTDGRAVVPVALLGGRRDLSVRLSGTVRYPLECRVEGRRSGGDDVQPLMA